MIAKRLHGLQDPEKFLRENGEKAENRYKQWIENYVAEDYTEAVKQGCGKSRSSYSCSDSLGGN